MRCRGTNDTFDDSIVTGICNIRRRGRACVRPTVMATPNKVSIHVLVEILKRWEDGATVKEISTALNLHRDSVSAHLRRALGMQTPPSWAEQGGRIALRNPKRPRAGRSQSPPVIYPDNPPRLVVPNELTPGESTRFWMKVAAPNERGCRLWIASIGTHCAGQFGAADSSIAYRVSWRLMYGPIPEDKQINHRCDVRACVEPTHLWLGTQAENLADMAAKGRRKGIPGMRGEDNVCAKINWKVVREIRTLRERDGIPFYKLAARFGISTSQVCAIATYKQWVNDPLDQNHNVSSPTPAST